MHLDSRGVRQMTRGRGWHGERKRHSDAARGIPTVQKTFKRSKQSNREVVEMADRKMDIILGWLDPLQDFRGHAWQMSVRHQDRLTNELDDIIEILEDTDLPDWMNEEVANAKEELQIAWASKDRERILSLEIARERLHNVISSFLKFEGKGLPGPYDLNPPWVWGDK